MNTANTISQPRRLNMLQTSPMMSLPISLKKACAITIMFAIEGCFGLHIGGLLGLLLGHLAGTVYANHFTKMDLQNMTQISQWSNIPPTFAQHGLILGAFIGAITITYISHKLSNSQQMTEQKQ